MEEFTAVKNTTSNINPNCISLTLNNRNIGDDIRTISRNSKLKKLVLNNFDKTSVKYLEECFNVLRNNQTLKVLTLSGSYINKAFAEYLSRVLKVNTFLTQLDLEKMNIYYDVADIRSILSNSRHAAPDPCKYIFPSLASNSTLTVLNLSHSNIKNESAKYISYSLICNSTLTVLKLNNTGISAEGAKCISNLLKTNSNLTTFDLSNNHISGDGGKYISVSLKINSSLTTFNLSNSIGVYGVKYISDALRINSTLTTLDLSYNFINSKGAKYISDSLKTNSALTELNLFGNEIDNKGAKYISDSLKSNSALTELNLNKNPIGAEGARYISDSLRTNSTLTTLDLRESKIGLHGFFYHQKSNLQTRSTVEKDASLKPDIKTTSKRSLKISYMR